MCCRRPKTLPLGSRSEKKNPVSSQGRHNIHQSSSMPPGAKMQKPYRDIESPKRKAKSHRHLAPRSLCICHDHWAGIKLLHVFENRKLLSNCIVLLFVSLVPKSGGTLLIIDLVIFQIRTVEIKCRPTFQCSNLPPPVPAIESKMEGGGRRRLNVKHFSVIREYLIWRAGPVCRRCVMPLRFRVLRYQRVRWTPSPFVNSSTGPASALCPFKSPCR